MISIAEAKAATPLRVLMERDGMVFRNVAGQLKAHCVFHEESTPSLVLHDEPDGGWFKCFGCDAKGDAINYLEQRHGLSRKEAVVRLSGGSRGEVYDRAKALPAPSKPIEPEKVIEPLDAEMLADWEACCADLYTDPSEIARWASWRGLRPAVIEWAARQLLCGKVIYNGQYREAFAIRRADSAMLSAHIRLAPNSRGNEHPKASWRYKPAGVGAWPFAVVPTTGIDFVKYVFVCEGQWDALALIDVMGWEVGMPDSVAVFGMRGATSFKSLLEYRFSDRASFFLIADRDAAGAKWFCNRSSSGDAIEDSFSMRLEALGFRVWSFWPTKAKDLNDAVKVMDEAARDAFRDLLRSKIPTKQRPARPTFRQWLAHQKNRPDEVGALGLKIVKGGKYPPARAPLWKWRTYAREVGWDLNHLQSAWEEWEKL